MANKAILVMKEMPNNCEECCCAYFTEGVHHDFCQAVGYETKISYAYESKNRPSWCPLKPVSDVIIISEFEGKVYPLGDTDEH